MPSDMSANAVATPPGMSANVVEPFRGTVARVPDRRALVIDHGSGSETATFRELWARADRISAGLVRAGQFQGPAHHVGGRH